MNPEKESFPSSLIHWLQAHLPDGLFSHPTPPSFLINLHYSGPAVKGHFRMINSALETTAPEFRSLICNKDDKSSISHLFAHMEAMKTRLSLYQVKAADEFPR